MLSFLLTAAISASETPMALCPPCHPEEEPATVFGFLLSLVKSVVSLLVIVFPLYKTFKAWESNRLRACRAMLAYWSAMTLLNALKDVSDELIGNYLNPHIHHLVLAAIKLAPLVLGPDTIYDLTVRPFFEQHEAEMDSLVLKGTEKAHELKERMEPTLTQVKEQVAELKEKTRATVEPTIEQIRESLRESVDSVKTTLGMETESSVPGSTAEGQVVGELTPEEAVRRDEELTVEEDFSSKTGLRQRSAKLESSTNNPAGVNAAAENEIELAKQRNVLVEKIVWGHGLSAKNEEYQRQQKEKEIAQDSVMADVHSVAEQLNTVPSLPPTPAVAETYNRTAAPALPPRPAATTEAITITNSAATTSTTAAAVPSVSASTTKSTVTATTPTTVLDARAGPSVTSKKTILLDTRSIPNVVETYTPDYQKEH